MSNKHVSDVCILMALVYISTEDLQSIYDNLITIIRHNIKYNNIQGISARLLKASQAVIKYPDPLDN